MQNNYIYIDDPSEVELALEIAEFQARTDPDGDCSTAIVWVYPESLRHSEYLDYRDGTVTVEMRQMWANLIVETNPARPGYMSNTLNADEGYYVENSAIESLNGAFISRTTSREVVLNALKRFFARDPRNCVPDPLTRSMLPEEINTPDLY